MQPTSGRSIQLEKLIPAGIDAVWKAWTTGEGVKSFFAPDCHIELLPGGVYEMYFDQDAEPGLRGGEGCTILAVDPPNMLSFTWNSPPDVPALRNTHQLTHVMIHLTEVAPDQTLVQLLHDGFGMSGDWKLNYNYFVRAWGEIVLPRLYRRFTEGPIDWDK